MLVTLLMVTGLAGFPSNPAGPGAQAQVPVVVDVDWLAERYADRDLIVLHVGNSESFQDGHIPGAKLLERSDFIARGKPNGLSVELPDLDRLEEVLEQRGISDRSRIVLYHAGNRVTVAGRAFFTLEWAGLRGRVHVLNGGLDAWIREGHPLSREEQEVPVGEVNLKAVPELLVDADWIAARLGSGTMSVLDARTPEYYAGTKSTRMPRQGHIAGAVNIPYDAGLDEQLEFLPTTDLQRLYREADLDPDRPIAVYCHVGQQASWAYLTARLAGYDVRLYDGSFEDWSNRRDLPVEPPSGTRQ